MSEDEGQSLLGRSYSGDEAHSHATDATSLVPPPAAVQRSRDPRGRSATRPSAAAAAAGAGDDDLYGDGPRRTRELSRSRDGGRERERSVHRARERSIHRDRDREREREQERERRGEEEEDRGTDDDDGEAVRGHSRSNGGGERLRGNNRRDDRDRERDRERDRDEDRGRDRDRDRGRDDDRDRDRDRDDGHDDGRSHDGDGQSRDGDRDRDRGKGSSYYDSLLPHGHEHDPDVGSFSDTAALTRARGAEELASEYYQGGAPFIGEFPEGLTTLQAAQMQKYRKKVRRTHRRRVIGGVGAPRAAAPPRGDTTRPALPFRHADADISTDEADEEPEVKYRVAAACTCDTYPMAPIYEMLAHLANISSKPTPAPLPDQPGVRPHIALVAPASTSAIPIPGATGSMPAMGANPGLISPGGPLGATGSLPNRPVVTFLLPSGQQQALGAGVTRSPLMSASSSSSSSSSSTSASAAQSGSPALTFAGFTPTASFVIPPAAGSIQTGGPGASGPSIASPKTAAAAQEAGKAMDLSAPLLSSDLSSSASSSNSTSHAGSSYVAPTLPAPVMSSLSAALAPGRGGPGSPMPLPGAGAGTGAVALPSAPSLGGAGTRNYGSMGVTDPAAAAALSAVPLSAVAAAALAGSDVRARVEVAELLSPARAKVSLNYYGSDVLHLKVRTDSTQSQKHAFFFEYGCITFFNFTPAEEQAVLRLLAHLEEDTLSADERDSGVEDLLYVYGEQSAVTNDTVTLVSDSSLEKLSVAFAMAQCVKLNVFEERIDQEIERNRDLPESLARTGSIGLTRNEMARKVGKLFIERNNINLHADILDDPEFFWEQAKFKFVYEKLFKYLELGKRVALLNKRLGIMKELFDMISDQLDYGHSEKLEYVIIYLIVIEVVIMVGWQIIVKDLLGFFHHGCGDE